MLLAVRSEPVAASAPAVLDTLPDLEEPERLPRRPSFVPATADMAPGAAMGPAGTLAIELSGVPPAHRANAGVAVFEPGFGAQLAWLPLPAEEAGDTVELSVAVPRGVPLRVTVAPAERAARHGWWHAVDVAAERGAGPLRLRVPVQRVRVNVTTDPPGLGPAVRLRRTDAPAWVPLAAFDGPPGAGRDARLELVLGPGSYELVPWSGGGWQPFALVVPGPGEVTANFRR